MPEPKAESESDPRAEDPQTRAQLSRLPDIRLRANWTPFAWTVIDVWLSGAYLGEEPKCLQGLGSSTLKLTLLGGSQQETQLKRTYCLAHNRNLSLSLSICLCMSLFLPLSIPFFIVQLFCPTIHLIVENLKLLSIRKLHCEWRRTGPKPRGQPDDQRAHNMSHCQL